MKGHTFTQAQCIEIALNIINAVRPYTDLPGDELTDSVSAGLVKGLQAAGAELDWINRIRKN
jgi:hypothetical protein